MSEAPRWLPLESNPDIMNNYLTDLGVANSQWQYVDVYGLDQELLMMVPQPVCSLLLLFPINEKYEKFRLEEEARLKADGQIVSDQVYFTTQTVGNACGTVGIIHSIANNLDKITLEDGSPLKNFLNETKNLTPSERAKKLEVDDGIALCHGNSAKEGQTKPPSADQKVDLHFLSIVLKDGCIYELDGRKPFPINHGQSTEETFLVDAAAVCKQFMARDPSLIQFNIVALSKL